MWEKLVDKRVIRFLNRKQVKEILGVNYNLSPKNESDLIKIFDQYGYKKIEEDFKSLSEMIINEVSYIFCRYRKLKKTSQYHKKSLMLRFGRNYKMKYDEICKKRKKGFKNTKEHWIDKIS